jgi:DNA polymerase epsilon subunit 1
MSALDTYAEVVSASADMGMDREPIASKAGGGDGLDHIIDIREYDVPYTIRVAIDKGNHRSTFLYNRISRHMQVTFLSPLH